MIQRIIVLLIISLSITSCASVYYISDHLSTAEKKEFKTYTTEDHCDQEISKLQAQRIKNAIDITMRDLGYQRAENGDLLVQYFVKNTTKQFVEECEDDYDRWTGGETCREMVITYEEGSIIIDMIDTDINTIIWHGAARGPSFKAMSKPDQEINRMVSKLLNYFQKGETKLK